MTAHEKEDRILDEVAKTVEQLYKKYGASVKRICEYRLRNRPDAVDDCVQDVFLTLFQKLRDGGKIENYQAWLYATAGNLILNAFKSEKSEKAGMLKYYEENRGKPLSYSKENMVFKQSEDEIMRLKDRVVDALTPEEQRLFHDRFVLRKSYEQITEEYAVNKNTAYQRVFRLQTRIRIIVKKLIQKG